MNNKDFTITKLRGSENFHAWQFAMKSVLEVSELIDCITLDGADETKVKEIKPEKLNQAKARLILAIDESLYVHVERCTTPIEIWNKLKDLFQDKGWSRKIGMLRTLIGIRLENAENMQDYVEKIIGASNKLISIGFEISDDWLGAILLAGLTDEYKPLIMSFEGSAAKVSADAIKMKLLDTSPSDQSSNITKIY